jgi:short-subunit dehydrogenase
VNSPSTVILVGATSALGRAFAGELAKTGHSLVLVGRSEDELARVASDIRLRFGGHTAIQIYDARQSDASESLLARVADQVAGALGGLVLCHGSMPDEGQTRADASLRENTIRVNYTSAVELIEAAVPHLGAESDPFILAVTSVAGDRGRPSNALYGSSKGALALYLSGLRSRLSREGVRVVTVKPGFIDTRMTWGLPGLFAVASPERVAADALRGLRKNRAVVYSPGFWRLIMLIIRLIPDPIFRRLQF